MDTSARINLVTFDENSVEIQDMRSINAGFTFSMSMSDLESESSVYTFDLSSLKVKAEDITSVGTSDCNTGVTKSVTSATQFSDTDNNGLSDSLSIVTGDSRIRVMTCQLTPALVLTVPGSLAAGNYQTTFSWSIS